ncbi:MAG: hypothetical protein U5J83_06255 [Bryobacterales bacterium]|nr:hypothetical protein [Bryobacterales bacterium]
MGIRRTIRASSRRLREIKLILDGVRSTDHPVMAHMIPIRRCNLACTYCNEYDDFSDPIPINNAAAAACDDSGRGSAPQLSTIDRRRTAVASPSR